LVYFESQFQEALESEKHGYHSDARYVPKGIAKRQVQVVALCHHPTRWVGAAGVAREVYYQRLHQLSRFLWMTYASMYVEYPWVRFANPLRRMTAWPKKFQHMNGQLHFVMSLIQVVNVLWVQIEVQQKS
jgi:hypothetical protein